MKLEVTGRIYTVIDRRYGTVQIGVSFDALSEEQKKKLLSLRDKNCIFKIYSDEKGQEKIGGAKCSKQ